MVLTVMPGSWVLHQGRRKQFLSGTAIGHLCVRTQLHIYAGVSSVQLSRRNTLISIAKNDLQLNSILTEFMPWEVVNFKG